MIIAVTGSIGSGKSTVSRMLASSLSATLISADILCNQELLPGTAGLSAIKARWGERFVEGGLFKRQAMRNAAFSDAAVRKELENILHPLAYDRLHQAATEIRSRQGGLVAEIPLLFEHGWTTPFDEIITVKVSKEELYRRVQHRDGRSKDEIERILAAQMSQKEKITRADCVIDNSGTICAAMSQVSWFVLCLQKEHGVKKW